MHELLHPIALCGYNYIFMLLTEGKFFYYLLLKESPDELWYVRSYCLHRVNIRYVKYWRMDNTKHKTLLFSIRLILCGIFCDSCTQPNCSIIWFHHVLNLFTFYSNKSYGCIMWLRLIMIVVIVPRGCINSLAPAKSEWNFRHVIFK